MVTLTDAEEAAADIQSPKAISLVALLVLLCIGSLVALGGALLLYG